MLDDYLKLPFEALMKITASTLTEETLQTVPASITVFTRKQIQQLGINTLEELMNHVPGYQSYPSDNIAPAYSSRSRRLGASNREVLVLLDGQRLNLNPFGNPGLYRLSLKNVARVEFLRGPGSAIYGANAFLGVINIITVSDLNEADVSTGSFQQRQASVNVSAEAGSLYSDLSVESHSSHGEARSIYDPVTARFVASNQETQKQSFYWRVQWRDGAGGGLGLQVHHMEDNDDAGYLVGTASDTYNHIEGYSRFWALHYRHVFNEHWDISSRLYDLPFLSDATFLAGTTPLGALVVGRLTLKGNDSGVENQLRWHQGSAKALLGLDYTRSNMDQVDMASRVPPGAFSAPAEVFRTNTRRVSAWYAQWQDELRQDLTYILGIRKDNFSDVEGHTSPRLGLIWQAGTNDTLKLLYGEAFRAPARNELSIKNNGFQLGNPSLKPEISKTFELVWAQIGAQHYSSVSVFDTNITNAVEITSTARPRTFVNGGTQHMSGLEAEWQWVFARDWQLRSHLSHLFKSPLAVNNDAEDLMGASLIYDSQQFSASVSVRHHGSSRDANTSATGFNDLGGYSVFDAHAHYEIAPSGKC